MKEELSKRELKQGKKVKIFKGAEYRKPPDEEPPEPPPPMLRSAKS